MSIESLKEDARRHEQKENWEKALDLYLQAIRQLDQREEDQDVSLFNRVGDLEVRLGQIERAVQHYERAVDLYVEAELPNNAIAVCKKVVRNVPERDAIYLKMGQIRGQQGFLTDARQNFLAYAERKQAAGDLEEAFRALVEFVNLAPEDIEIRLALASQLAQHERTEEAVEQFREARRRLILAGEDEQAEEIEDQIHELDPDVELADAETIEAEGLAAEPETAADPWGAFSDFDSGEREGVSPLEARKSRIPGAGESDPDEDADLVGDDDFVVGGLEGLDISSDEEEVEEIEGDETGVEEAGFGEDLVEAGEEEPAGFELGGEETEEDAEEESIWVEPGEEGLEEIAGEWDEEEWEDEEEAEPLPMMDFGEDEEEEETVGEEGTEEEEEAEAEVEEEEEELGEWDEEEEEEVEPLPTMGFEDDEEEPGVQEVEAPSAEESREAAMEEAAAEERVEKDPAELREDGERLLGDGNVDEAWPLLEEAHQRLADRGDVKEALEIVGRMTEERPDAVPLHQRKVEYAYRMFDDEVLKDAYLGLAGALRTSGDEERARGVYRQVLETDPEDEEAQRALSELSGGEAPTPTGRSPAEVASSEEYVDLGAMILEEEEEKTTRFVVPAGAPSGDEAADFQKMLSQFKEKVAENLETDDVASHYDLGTAYKEMGLVDEAISEFQAALRAAHGHLPTYEMLGQCFLEKGQNEAAIRTLERALEAPHEIEDELLGIYYYLGRAHQSLGREEEALDFYDKVFALDINFMDVTERLRDLR